MDVALHEVKPAHVEWAYWVSGGVVVGRSGRPASASGAIGFELTRQALLYRGFPAGEWGWLALSELRIGPWLSAATRDDGGLVEAGLDLKWMAVYRPTWGTWDLRLGAGYGAFGSGRAPFMNATLLWGVESVRNRYQRRGYCEPSRPAATVAEASVVRVFFTHRAALTGSEFGEFVLGIEVSPSMLLPPWSGSRFIGNEP